MKKINPLMVSLAQEHFPDTERHLFGPNFEQRLKTRSETAETIGKASRLGKPFFRGGASRGFQRPRGGRQWNQYRQVRPFQPGAVLHSGVEDNPPDSRAHGSTAHGSSNPISEKPTSNQFAQRYVFRNFTTQFNTEGASNWASKSLHPTMDDAHTGPVGFANHSGSSHRIYESSCSAFLARNSQSTPSTGEGVRSGNERTISQKSHSSSPNPHPIKQGIHKFYIHSPPKRWGEPPSYKFKTTKSVLNLRTFQNRGNPYVERPSKTKRLSCKDRPQGRLPNCADLERSSKIPSISVEGNTARICLPPFWVSHSPQGVHKVDETGSSGFKTTGYSSNNLPRRHTNYGRIGSLSITPCSFNSEPPGGSGIYSQLQQVPVNPLPEYRVFGFSDQFNQSHPPVAKGETQENPKDLPRYSRKDRNFGSRVIKIPGPPNLFHPGHFPRPPPLPTSSKAEEHYNDLRAIVRGHINTRFSSPRGSSVVARPPSRVEWQSAIPTPNRPYNRDRCLSKGLGGILRRGQHWRPMVFRGEKTTHQLSRATRRVVCNQNIHKDHSMCTCETIDGQCSSSCIYKQNGGYSFTCFSQPSNRPVGVVSRESTDSVSSTLLGKIKHTSRQGIEDFNRLERLETQSKPISSNIENMGPTRNRSLCITSDISASSLCQLEARSSSHTDRCIHNELAKYPRVRLPAIRLNRPMLTAGHVSESRTINSNISSLASSALVPTTTPTVYRYSHSAPSISRSLNERQPATSSEQPPAG